MTGIPRTVSSPAPLRRVAFALAVVGAGLVIPGASLLAQAPPAPRAPAFSLASSQIFRTSGEPYVFLTFQQLGHLDFRVYRVKDVETFFAGLRDPHVLGSPEPYVPQEPTLLERVAAWKARQRHGLRSFVRSQFSPAYRRARSVARDRARLAERRVVTNLTQFAQVPLLNREQLVVSWRERLPRTREPEVRRIPLELASAGVYLVEAVHDTLRAHTIVVVSDVGVLTKSAPGEIVAWAVHRASGAPKAECGVSTIVNRLPSASTPTGPDGVAVVSVAAQSEEATLTLVRCGQDVVVADPGGFYLRDRGADLVGYVYTDRPIYRPGHTVHAKAILRWRERGLLRPFDRPEAEVSVVDSTDKVLFREARPVDAFGAVSASVALPASAALGPWTVRVASGDAQASATFDVQEYRKPEFEIAMTPASRFVVQGQPARVRLNARYFFGQPVAHARVHYVVHRSSHYWSPWRWVDSPDYEVDSLPGFYGGDQVLEGDTTLDASGAATVLVPTSPQQEEGDATLRIEARVRDASGREVTEHTTLVATWARLLLALSTDGYLQRPGATATARARAVDYEGRPQAGQGLEFTLERVRDDSSRSDGPRVDVVGRGPATTDAAGLARWQVSVPDTPGDYRISVSTPSEGRRVTAAAAIYVPDSAEMRYETPDRLLELVADRQTYQPGDTARLVIRGERLTTPILVTKEREQTTWHRVVSPPPDGTVEVPVEEGDVGDVWVHVAFVRDDKLFRAERRLRVPPAARTLNVSIEPAAAVARPRDPASVAVRITDAAGQPVRAQFSLGVVDEAIYALAPDTTPDPVRYFHRRSYSRVGTQFSRDYSFVGYSGKEQLQLAQRRRPFTLADFKGDRPERAEVRREFPDAIFWIADATTDAQGLATLEVKYPDALTTWRVTARAITEDTRAGSAVTRTTVTKDIILRLPIPRFLTEGDTMQLAAVAHNYHEDARALDVSVSAAGVTPVDPPQQPVQVEVPSMGARATTWTFRAERAGPATVSGSATAPDDGDRLEVSLPILPFGLKRTESRSGSSTTSGPARVQLEVPESSNPAERRIEITLAPTLAGSMLGALDALVAYPYGCTEQILSSFLPNLLVTRALQQLRIAPAERVTSADQLASQGLRRLIAAQHEGGGWGWWPTGQDHPFMTAYALQGLLEAERAGLSVERDKTIAALNATLRLYAAYPRAVPDLKAYLAWAVAQALAADVPGDAAATGWSTARVHDELWAARDRMSSYGRALLALTFDAAKDARADALRAALVDEARTQGDLAWWPSDGDPLLGEAVDTSVEATALALQAIAPHDPGHPTLDRAVRWLLANQRGGAWWGTTKGTAMALYGLLAVLQARNERPTTFAADVRVNGEVVGTHTFTPASWTAPDPVRIGTAARAGANDVTIEVRGAGSLYWSASATYYDAREPVERTGSRALALKREYFSLQPVSTKGRTIYRPVPFSGSARGGDVLLVRVTAAGTADWQYLVVEDPIPAGFEALQAPELYEIERGVSWWTGSRREYRDNRVVQFLESFEQGRYELHYLLKATTPGTYRAMPAQISPMYVPGVAASTTTQQVVIEAGAP